MHPSLRDQCRSGRALDFFNDIPLSVSVEFGRTEMTIGELLNLKLRSLLELAREQQEPFDVRVNGRLIARGEIVVINDHYGIRITEVIAPEGWDAAEEAQPEAPAGNPRPHTGR